MPAPSDRFLDAAVQPFGDNPELRIHARRTLEETVRPDAADDSWEKATTALKRHDHSTWSRHWSKLLLAVTLIAGGVFGVPAVMDLRRVSSLVKGMADIATAPSITDQDLHQQLAAGLSPDQRLRLFGDTSKHLRSEQVMARCIRYPENPAYYADYVMAYANDHSALPPDFEATVARIDPDNGWFPCFAAGVLAHDVVKPRKQTTQEKKDHAPRRWDVADETRLNECLAQLRKSTGLARFDSYQKERSSGQLALIPPPKDFGGQLLKLYFMAGQTTPAIRLRILADAVAAQAERLGAGNDRAEFKKLQADAQSLIHRQVQDGQSLVDQLVADASARVMLANLEASAASLGLENEATRMGRMRQTLEHAKEQRQSRVESAADETALSHGSMLLHLDAPMVDRQVDHPPALEMDALTPGRRIEQAAFGRFFCLIVWGTIAAACLICVAQWSRHGLLLRKVSARLPILLTKGDWIWIAASGVLPLAYYQSIYQLTPLGGHDWGFHPKEMFIPFFQIAAWLTLSLVAPLVVARWRLRKRGIPLALRIPSPVFGWLALLLAAAALPLSGMVYAVSSPGSEGPLLGNADPGKVGWAVAHGIGWILAAGICLLLAQGWWLVTGIRALFGSRARSLGRLVTSRIMATGYLASLLAITLWIPILEAQERYWVARDTMQPGLGTDVLGMNAHEEQVTRIKRAELLEVLDPLQENH